jgi:protein SCO1/2
MISAPAKFRSAFVTLSALSMLFLAPMAASAASDSSVYDLPLTFTNQKGESAPLSQYRGRPVVMTMTYSSCQFACPRILQRMKNLQKAYREKGMKADFVVVTFDPARDSPERLKEVQKTTPETADWTFLSGKDAATRQLSMVLGIRYERNPEDGHISHDNKILILDEKGVIRKELNGLQPDVSEAF